MIQQTMNDLQQAIISMDLGSVEVTIDQLQAANHLQQGRAVVLINPPSIEPIAGDVYEMQFSIIVAAGPFDRPLRATETMAPVVEELINSPLMPERATPQTFESFEGRQYPCYVLTITTDSD